MEPIIQILAKELDKSPEHVENVVRLIDEGNTIPFIARYRKELHGAMDDTALRTLADRLQYLRNLGKRREEVKSAIEGQGKLTEELAAAKQRMTELEDQLFSLRAQALTDRGDLLLLEPPTRPDGARKLADAAAKASGGLAAVFAGAESSYVYALVQADGADISPLVKRLNAALSGRGGGRNGFAQGSVQADRTAIYDFFRKEGIECPTC